MTFSEQTWASRVGSMGDQAEAKFEEVYPNGWVRTGLNRPPLRVADLALRERYRPDYLTSAGYVEVQGFGKQQTMALKVEKYNCLNFWSDVMPVRLFIYDSFRDRHRLVPLREVDTWLSSADVKLKRFPEGKPFFCVPATVIFGADG